MTAEVEEQEEEGTSPIEWARFALRAAKRRRKLSLGIVFVGLVLTVLAVMLWPRTYSTDAKITVERNAMMPALADPHRAVPLDWDAPTKGATDAIYAHDNLEKLVRETNLVARWDTSRPPILRAKDSVMGMFRSPPSDADRERMLVSVLEKQLHVSVDANSITISVDWTDPQTAYDIVAAVQKSFLDGRHNVEVSVISEAIGILEQHANEERDNVASALTEMQRLNDLRAAATAPRPRSTSFAMDPTPVPTARTTASASTANGSDDLLEQLDVKRRAIKSIEDGRAQKLSQLNAQLTDLRATLAPAHPQVIELERKIEAAKEDPPELVTLRNEERDLVGRIAAANAAKVPLPAPKPPPIATVPIVVPQEVTSVAVPPEASDTLIEVQRQKLQTANVKYGDLMNRIDAARIELETARAAFKYRYNVVIEPEIPKAPKKPNVPIVFLGGLIATLLFALGAPLGADVASGRLIEPWQAEKKLKLPVLGEVTRV